MKKSKTIKFINQFINDKPQICLILGSGLDTLINKIKQKKIIDYKKIPNFFESTVSGHKGEFVYGYINKKPILCARGRLHYYEGYSFDEIGTIVEIFNYYNPKLCIITNSSGCLNTKWKLGNFMIIIPSKEI